MIWARRFDLIRLVPFWVPWNQFSGKRESSSIIISFHVYLYIDNEDHVKFFSPEPTMDTRQVDTSLLFAHEASGDSDGGFDPTMAWDHDVSPHMVSMDDDDAESCSNDSPLSDNVFDDESGGGDDDDDESNWMVISKSSPEDVSALVYAAMEEAEEGVVDCEGSFKKNLDIREIEENCLFWKACMALGLSNPQKKKPTKEDCTVTKS